jgi:sensor histidine kinase YesM
MTQAAEQIIERLGGEFSGVERLAHSLKQNVNVNALMREQDTHGFFTLAGEIDGLLDTKAFNLDFIDSIVLFGADRQAAAAHNYYRLTGRLSNKECQRLANMVYALDMPSHLSVELEGKRYIGYADALTEQPGAVVILIEEEKILELLRAYDQSGSLYVAVTANNEVIAANTDRIDLFLPDAQHEPVIHSRLGITPYRISVAADAVFMSESLSYFTVVALITAALFGIVLLVYTRIMNRSFFMPMVKVIDSIETLNTNAQTDSLPHVQSEEFDGLIDKINEMLLHIETKNTEVKNAEIEKQKALVFSLKKQINAHFTIGTLNTVRLLVERGEYAKAETVALGLTSLVRYAHDREELINIWDELTILENYIDIMNSRYNGKLEVDFDFDDHLMDYYMPRMLLQPIIENSIVHGFKEMDAGCCISVKAELRDGGVNFTVKDNGRGMGEKDLSTLTEKLNVNPDAARGYENIALLNIKNRLFYYFKDAGHFNIQSEIGGGVEVSLTMPLITEAGGSV